MSGYFVTGIGTDVGKTVASAILTEKSGWNYWKPIQTGPHPDRVVVESLVSNGHERTHPEVYWLPEPISPHAAAARQGIRLSIDVVLRNRPSGNLVIEGAGGIFAPINESETMLDLMLALRLPVILISRHYVGSINHTLLTLESLFRRDVLVRGILFNGPDNPETESFILENSKVNLLGRLDPLPELTHENVVKSAVRIEL